MSRSLRIGLVTALLVMVLDQISKWAVLGIMGSQGPASPVASGHSFIVLLPIADLVMVWNHGVSFGFGNDNGVWNSVIFSVLAIAISGFLVWWMTRARTAFAIIGLGFVVGGALGNVIDRVRWGAVEDFMYVHLGAFNWWPAFNLADSAICVGAGLLVVDGLFVSRDSPMNRA